MKPEKPSEKSTKEISVTRSEFDAVNKSANRRVTDIRQIAKMASKEKNISETISDNTIDNLRAFTIAYTRSQLNRLVSLTNNLSKLENKLIDRIDADDNVSPVVIIRAIDTIRTSVDNTVDLIKQVTTNEDYLNVVINQSQVINNTLNQTTNNNNTILANSESRNKIRDGISKLISIVDNIEKDEGVTPKEVVNLDEIPEE